MRKKAGLRCSIGWVMANQKYNFKSIKGFNLLLFAKAYAENISRFEMWLFVVFWVAQSITVLSEKKEIEIAGGHTGRRHKRKGSNLSRETEGRDVAIGLGLLASPSREWGKAHILPWGLQKEADTTHTSIAFLWPPGPQGGTDVPCVKLPCL